MLKIWVDRENSAPEGWRRVKDINEAIQLIEFYWQDQWEMYYIDGLSQEEIENSAIISLPYYNVIFAEWIQKHPAAKGYLFEIRGK